LQFGEHSYPNTGNLTLAMTFKLTLNSSTAYMAIIDPVLFLPVRV
jgi:hypothetical protein